MASSCWIDVLSGYRLSLRFRGAVNEWVGGLRNDAYTIFVYAVMVSHEKHYPQR